MKHLRSIMFISILSLCCVVLLTFVFERSRIRIEENRKIDVIKGVLYSFGIDYSGMKDQGATLFRKKIKEREVQGLTFYSYANGGDTKYCFPITARGLWGIIYGFVSLKSDFRTVFRVTFTYHKETPGLGAQIDEDEYLEQYHDLEIYGAGGAFGLISQKGGRGKLPNGVDAITGATITSDGVVKGINESLKKYLERLGEFHGG